MTKEEYKIYLQSPHWLLVKKHFYEKNKKECKVCGSHLHLNIHHKTYVHFGMELQRELICLCENCHNAAHKLNLTELNDGQLNKLKKIKVTLKWTIPSWKKKKWKYKGKPKYNEAPKKKNKVYSSAKCPPVNKFTKEQVEEYKRRINGMSDSRKKRIEKLRERLYPSKSGKKLKGLYQII